MRIILYKLPIIALLSLVQSCSFSTSSDSSSGSLGSVSNSSESSVSSSPSSSDGENSYEVQIMNYTSAYLTTAEFERDAFSKGIAEIAISNGITSWEDDEATLTGIGRALKKSGISGNVYEVYKKSLANSNEKRMQIIQNGYNLQR